MKHWAFLLFVFSFLSQASPSPLIRDLFEADEIVRGLVVDIEPTTTDLTSVSIDVHYSLNHSSEQLVLSKINPKDWQVGEQVVLFLDKEKAGESYKLHLGRLGKYVVRRLASEEVLFNQGNQQDFYSKLDWVGMQKLVRQHKQDFFQVLRERTVFNYQKGTRKPASFEEIENETSSGTTILWLALFFGAIGGLYHTIVRVQE